MVRTLMGVIVVAVWVVTFRVAADAQNSSAGGWKIPATAATEKNPFPSNEAVIAAGTLGRSDLGPNIR